MTDSQGMPSNQKIESLLKYSNSLLLSIKTVRIIGYALLVLAGFDLIQIFAFSQFTDPVWEFELIGQIVDRIAVPLIGIAFVCLGQQVNRLQSERLLLRAMAWAMLLVTILLTLLIPLNIVSAVRLDRQSGQQLSARASQAVEQLNQAQDEVSQVSSRDQAQQLLNQFEAPNNQAERDTSLTLEDIKGRLSSSLAREKRRVNNQVAAVKKNQRRSLLKNSVKWNLGALVSAALFFLIWRHMKWARSPSQ